MYRLRAINKVLNVLIGVALATIAALALGELNWGAATAEAAEAGSVASDQTTAAATQAVAGSQLRARMRDGSCGVSGVGASDAAAVNSDASSRTLPPNKLATRGGSQGSYGRYGSGACAASGSGYGAGRGLGSSGGGQGYGRSNSGAGSTARSDRGYRSGRGYGSGNTGSGCTYSNGRRGQGGNASAGRGNRGSGGRGAGNGGGQHRNRNGR